MRASIALALVLTLTGCVSLSAGGAAVRITNNPDVVRGCKFLGNFSLSTTTKTPEMGERLFRNKVAEDGGNVGHVIHIQGNGSIMQPLEYSGDEYLCPTPAVR